MIGDGHVRVHRPLSGPLLEGRVRRRQFFYIVPNGFDNGPTGGSRHARGKADVEREKQVSSTTAVPPPALTILV